MGGPEECRSGECCAVSSMGFVCDAETCPDKTFAKSSSLSMLPPGCMNIVYECSAACGWQLIVCCDPSNNNCTCPTGYVQMGAIQPGGAAPLCVYQSMICNEIGSDGGAP